MFFWRLFFEAVAKSISGAVGLQGAGGSGALDGGGIPSESRVRVSGGRFKTPSGQSGTGAADLRASPPAAGPPVSWQLVTG